MRKQRSALGFFGLLQLPALASLSLRRGVELSPLICHGSGDDLSDADGACTGCVGWLVSIDGLAHFFGGVGREWHSKRCRAFGSRTLGNRAIRRFGGRREPERLGEIAKAARSREAFSWEHRGGWCWGRQRDSW